MTAPRRDTDRETADAVRRVWQTYADEIGVPKAPSAGGHEPLPQLRPDRMSGRRPARVTVKGVVRLALTAGAVVVASTGIALWLEPPTFRFTADRPAPTLASAPAGEAPAVAPRSTPGQRAGDGLQPSTSPASTPSAAVDSLRSRAKPDDSVSGSTNAMPPRSPIVGPDRPTTAAPPRTPVTPDTQRNATPSAEAKPRRTDVMYRISFGFGSDAINGESQRILDTIVAAMNANPHWRVTIGGHTDALGTSEYNQALSERRARAVKAYLQSAGIAPRRLSAVGYGASHPIAPDDAMGNALNRRVEFYRQ